MNHPTPAIARIPERMVAMNEALVLASLRQHELIEAAELLNARLKEEIAERMRAEEALRDAQKMEAIGQLAGGLAHDLNNYLAVIIGNLDLLNDLPQISEEASKFVAAAIGGAERGAELTRSLLAFARRQPLDPRVIDPGARIADLTRMLDRTIGENIVIDLGVPEGLWPIMVDGAQFDTCVVNLANNARDAMPKGGTLSIALSNIPAGKNVGGCAAHSRDRVLIEFTDTGLGMTPQTLARVFEPFFTTKGPSHGTGLGLSMTHGFVHQSGGTIDVASMPGNGTSISIFLPRVPEAVVELAARPRPAPLQRGCERILLVEDNKNVRATAGDQLTSLGYDVTSVESGDAAVVMLENNAGSFDLVFSDVMMPGKVDGAELARLVLSRWPCLRVLLTTGFSGGAVTLLEEEKAVGVLCKPYRKADLARAVRSRLDD